jgi:alpha-tubulin suppressor-like RCC1 family protein
LAFTQVAMGLTHACALRQDGAVYCWGSNVAGQLGNGSFARNEGASQVALPETQELAAGGDFACARLRNGTVMCWGENSSGQLGNGTQTRSAVPVQAMLEEPATILRVGRLHACAKLSSGIVKCWGSNVQKQMGLPAGVFARPVQVWKERNIADLGLGFETTCIVDTNGTPHCAGLNNVGQLGSPTAGDAPSEALLAVKLPNARRATSLSVGFANGCAVLDDQSVACWGFDAFGVLGRGVPGKAPGLVPGVAARRVTVGREHACAELTDGQLSCWGTNERGQLAAGTRATSPKPQAAQFPPGVGGLSAGENATCGVGGGAVYCVGSNTFGQATAGPGSSYEPTKVGSVTDVSSVAASQAHTCVRQAAGVRCWGENRKGELGVGDALSRQAPGVLIPGASTYLSVGYAASCSGNAQSLQCWGDNSSGQLGIGVFGGERLSPNTVGTLGDVKTAVQGLAHTCVLRQGAVQCWGINAHQVLGLGLGPGSATNAPAAAVPLGGTVVNLAAGRYHNCAVLTDNTVKCWGYNGNGQLALPTTKENSPPVQVADVSAVEVATGFESTCAIGTGANREVSCWGYNGLGQLGVGDTNIRTQPTKVQNLTDVTRLAIGTFHTCGLWGTGSVACWGQGNVLATGFSDGTLRTTPQTLSLPELMTDISAGAAHTCAVGVSGALYCWGDNGRGQLGLPITDVLLPVAIALPR